MERRKSQTTRSVCQSMGFECLVWVLVGVPAASDRLQLRLTLGLIFMGGTMKKRLEC